MSAPTELDPMLVFERIRDALEQGTDLQAMDDDYIGTRTEPSPLLHGRFRIESDEIEFPRSRARPGDSVMLEETLAVQIVHDLDPNQRHASLRLSSRDFIAALRALLTRVALSGLGQPLAVDGRRRREGHSIVTTFRVRVAYHVTLPEAQ